MADDRVKISALDSASTMDTGDLFPVTQDRGGALKTNKATMSQIATEVVNGIEYTTALDTDSKKPLGAINELLDRIIGLYPVQTFSATPIATFTDAAENVPMKSLIVNIQPKQASGTPTPSSPLPISGFTGANVTHTGENRLNKEDITTSSASWVLNNMPLTLLAGTYTLSFDFSGTSGAGSFRLDDASGTAIYTYNQTLTNGRMSYTFTINQTASYIKLYCDAYGTFSNFMLCEGTNTNYVAYTATSYPISWQTEAGTVYGGWYDVTTGKLVIETVIVSDLSQLNWEYQSANSRFTSGDLSSVVKRPPNNSTIADFILCSIYGKGTSNQTASSGFDNVIAISSAGNLQLRDTSLNGDLDALATRLENQQFVYGLATPIEIDLTPTTIKTQGGTENIFADCGDVEGEYRADIQAYIDGLVNNGGNRSLNKNLELAKTTEKTEEPEETDEPKEEEKK